MSDPVSAADLTSFAGSVLAALGAPLRTTEHVAGSLVESDLRGHDSHGVRRLVPYADLVRRGVIDPTAEPHVEPDTPPAVTVVDGTGAFGQLTASLGTTELVAKVGRSAVACTVLRRCQHVGRLGEYVEQVAAAGHVGFAFANADPAVAPWGGRDRMLGTNPFAWAVPVADGAAPLVVDFATSATAEGKLAVARGRGEEVAPGLLLDADGHPTTDPGDFYAGGALLPFGAHKGYGMGFLADVVAGLLSGTGSASDPDYDGTFGTVLVAVDITSFVDAETFTRDVERLRDRIHATSPAAGTDRVLVPGEPEWATRAVRTQSGIPLAPGTRTELAALADELEIPAPQL